VCEWQKEWNKARESSAVYQAKLFGDALSGTLPKMPTDCVELTAYFRGVEQLFSDFKVEPEPHLLNPHLTENSYFSHGLCKSTKI